jgi:hypothetical protein
MSMPRFTAERSLGTAAGSYVAWPAATTTSGTAAVRPQEGYFDHYCCEFCVTDYTYCSSKCGGGQYGFLCGLLCEFLYHHCLSKCRWCIT